jgi:hypothetical protein
VENGYVMTSEASESKQGGGGNNGKNTEYGMSALQSYSRVIFEHKCLCNCSELSILFLTSDVF